MPTLPPDRSDDGTPLTDDERAALEGIAEREGAGVRHVSVGPLQLTRTQVNRLVQVGVVVVIALVLVPTPWAVATVIGLVLAAPAAAALWALRTGWTANEPPTRGTAGSDPDTDGRGGTPRGG